MMINTNQNDRIDMAQDIAKVRETGITNMWDYYKVIEVLYDLGCDWTAEYLENNKKDYVNLLMLSGDY